MISESIKIEPLQNPDADRESCVGLCLGCNRVFETKTNILFSENSKVKEEISRVCRAYEKPSLKWKRYQAQFSYGIKKDIVTWIKISLDSLIRYSIKKDKSTIRKVIHFNPCNLATHVTHTEMHLHSDGKVRVGQQKQSGKKKNK